MFKNANLADFGEEMEGMQGWREVDREGDYTERNGGGLHQDGVFGLIYFYVV